jgi:PAS domain S-box-containing protein
MGGIGPMRKSRISQRLDIRRFLDYLTGISDSSLHHALDVEQQTRRVYLLFFVSVIGIITLISLGIFVLVQKHVFLGICDMVLASILTGNLLHGRRYKRYTFNIYLGLSFAAMLFVYVFLTGGVNGTGFVWYYAFPLIASFLLGSKKGAIATLLISSPVVALFLMKTPPSVLADYDFDFKLRFISSFLVVIVFSYLFEYSRERNREELQRAHDDLEKRVDERTSALQEAIQSLQKEISERRRTEEALRESEETARGLSQENATMAEIGRIVSSTLDIDQIYDRFAAAVRRLIHFDRISICTIDSEHQTVTVACAVGADRVGRRPGDVFPLSQEDNKCFFQTRSSVFVQTEDIHEIEERFSFLLPTFQYGFRSMISVPLISKDQVIGTLNLRSFKVNAYTDRDLRIAESIGIQIAGAIANALLFNERKRAEEALRESEDKYRTVLENIEDGYYEVDLAGNFTFSNDSMCRILGYPKEELMGMNDRQYTDKENAKKVFQAFNKVYRTGEPRRECDWEIIRKDGTKKYVDASVSLRRDSSGKPIGFRGIVRDITERKRAEKALKEKSEELVRSNKDLEQFAYVASHDLQEPLRMVTSYVQLLARRYKGKLDSDADEFIGFAVDGAIRMWKLINDLLTYSRVGMRGKELEPTDCETILHQSLNNLKVAIEEKEAVVTHDPLPTVMADSPQLGQLFQNLIGNAIKFRGNEAPRIHVSASQNGNGWTFSVRDNGIGIAPEYAERIFIIFQRLHRREEYPGTGIGLAVCKKIVERHGGRIWVESEVGKGATFYFTLLASKEEQLSS